MPHLGPNVQLVPRIAAPHLASGSLAARAAWPAAAEASRSNGTAPPAPPSAAAAPEPVQDAHSRARLYCLYDFVAAHGRLPAAQDTHRGVAVGQWAEKCRQLQRQGTLDAALAAALQSIPAWTWQPQLAVLSEQFGSSLHQLAAYAHVHGVPLRGSGGGGGGARAGGAVVGSARASPLIDSRAAASLRKQFMMQRKRGVLTQQQVDAVVATVPGWRWDPRVRSPPLDRMVQLLADFYHEHGRLPKGDERLPDGFLVGEWCMARRGEHARGALEADVAAVLERGVPGWSWNAQDTAFEASLALLRRFAALHGRMPTQREALDGVRIGAWCNKRRLQYKTGGMPADRAAALEAVPGWWWSADQMPGM